MGFAIYSLSEYAVSVDFGGGIDADTLQRVTGFDALLHNQPFAGFRTTVPAYTTVTVIFDPATVVAAASLAGTTAYERVYRYLVRVESAQRDAPPPATRAPVTIPVCYGGAFGPDLEAVADHHGLTAQAVLELHCAATYQVHFIGFTPGFAYLGGLSDRLATPRKADPRGRVPAGSVGIAGTQTGIYPLDTPGGWQLIGRTPWRLFDPDRASPALLNAGDRVVFRPIPPDRFATYPSPDAASSP